MPDGEPFPTTYWLTCRHLVAAVSRLEAAGGVERWSAAVEADPGLRAGLERASEEQREIRRGLAEGDRTGRRRGARARDRRLPEPSGAQVPPRPRRLRLARPGYGLGEAVLEEVPERWPSKCCSDLSLASPR